MTGRKKINIAAGGIVFFALMSALIILIVAAKPDVGILAIKSAFSMIFAFLLIRGIAWAKWVVGTLSGFSAAMPLLIFLDWDAQKSHMLSWAGLWMLLMAGFHGWVACNLLFDRGVAAYFSDQSLRRKRNQ